MRMLARFEGIPQKTAIEHSLMDRFFLFQVFVRASRAALGKVSYGNTSEWLSCCRTFFWYYQHITLPSEPPEWNPDKAGSEPTQVFHVLLEVSEIAVVFIVVLFQHIVLYYLQDFPGLPAVFCKLGLW
jgi:hypothetical protein